MERWLNLGPGAAVVVEDVPQHNNGALTLSLPGKPLYDVKEMTSA